MKRTDIELTNNDIIEYNLQMLPKVKDVEPIYSIVACARNYNIKGGGNIEIDIYLTGLGIPDANKLVLVWTSPNIIDDSSPGIATWCIWGVKKKLDGKDMVVPLTGKEQHSELSPDGVILNLPEPFFLPVPKSKEQFAPQIMAERNSGGYHPISISLKTLRKSKSGDYKIDATLTYRYHNIVKQVSNKIEFHITSWWDRNQQWVVTAGTIIAFTLLVLTFLNIWGFIGG